MSDNANLTHLEMSKRGDNMTVKILCVAPPRLFFNLTSDPLGPANRIIPQRHVPHIGCERVRLFGLRDLLRQQGFRRLTCGCRETNPLPVASR